MLESCALLTVTSNPLLENVSNTSAYMPAVLRREDYAAWLNGTPAQAAAVLRTYPPDQMIAHPISPRINSLKFNDSLLIRRVEIKTERRLAVSG